MQGAETGHEESGCTTLARHPTYPEAVDHLSVPDDQVQIVIKTITEVNQTGKKGDGKDICSSRFGKRQSKNRGNG